MKKGFISILTLLIFLALTLTTSFIYEQNENTSQYISDLYNKKQSQYLAETVLNIYIDENYENIKEKILNDEKSYRSNKNESYWISEDEMVIYNGKTYYFKIAYMYRKEEAKLSDVYRIETSKIEVGDSIARAEAIFKVIDPEGNSGQKDIKLMAKYTY